MSHTHIYAYLCALYLLLFFHKAAVKKAQDGPLLQTSSWINFHNLYILYCVKHNKSKSIKLESTVIVYLISCEWVVALILQPLHLQPKLQPVSHATFKI